MLGGLLAGVIAIAPAAQAVDILDATKVRDAGFDLIYQARDLDLPQVTSTTRLLRNPCKLFSRMQTISTCETQESHRSEHSAAAHCGECAMLGGSDTGMHTHVPASCCQCSWLAVVHRAERA